MNSIIGVESGTLPKRFRNSQQAHRIFGDQTETYTAALLRGDPLADAVVVEIRADSSKQARAKFELALEEGIGAVQQPGPALVALFRQVDTLPDWVDFDRMDEGGAMYVRDGDDTFLALLASLVAGYRSGDAAKPLTMTRRFIDYAPRRAEETLIWMLNTVRPGGMRRFGGGFKMTLRVRLVHAFVRAGCLSHPKWRFDLWGLPVNQFDLARGICGEFTSVAFDARRRLGYPLAEEDEALMLHLWRYIGYVLGIDGELLPTTMWDARQLVAFADLTATSIDEDSKALANAVMNITPSKLRDEGKTFSAWLTTQIVHGYMRQFAGEEIADQYRLKNNVFKYLCAIKRPWLRRAHEKKISSESWNPKMFAIKFIDKALRENVCAVTDVADMEEAGLASSGSKPAPVMVEAAA